MLSNTLSKTCLIFFAGFGSDEVELVGDIGALASTVDTLLALSSLSVVGVELVTLFVLFRKLTAPIMPRMVREATLRSLLGGSRAAVGCVCCMSVGLRLRADDDVAEIDGVALLLSASTFAVDVDEPTSRNERNVAGGRPTTHRVG